MEIVGQRNDPVALLPGKRSGTHLQEAGVDPRFCLDRYKKFRHPGGIGSPVRPALSELLYRSLVLHIGEILCSNSGLITDSLADVIRILRQVLRTNSEIIYFFLNLAKMTSFCIRSNPLSNNQHTFRSYTRNLIH